MNGVQNNSVNNVSKRSITALNRKPVLFGCDLDEMEAANCGQALPPFIEHCLVYLVRNAISSVGIFRKSGVKSRIMSLKEQSEEGVDINLSDVCVYDMADVIKMWFRELKPKQLLTQQIISSFKQNKKEFTFCAIPDTHRVVLQIILRFLALTANNSNVNQMNCHNLAICWTPSLCECPDPDQQLFDAQECLEFCIDNCEQLFVISMNLYRMDSTPNDSQLPHKHEATALIECGPNDALNRILYERQVFDPSIIEWNISEDLSPNSDIFIVRLQSSAFLPIKTFTIERKWRINSLNNIEIIENGPLYQSRWSLTAQDGGVTAVAHNIAVDLRYYSIRPQNDYQIIIRIYYNIISDYYQFSSLYY